MGDGFLATFDGPARGIRCATAIREAVGELGVKIRAGLHTGELEVIGSDVGGMAMNIGARVGARAGAGEVLVSKHREDLVVSGSGIEFADRGEHELKGVPGAWRLLGGRGRVILAIDQGTTGTTCIVFDEHGRPAGRPGPVRAALSPAAGSSTTRRRSGT